MELPSVDFFGRWIGISAHRLSHLMTKTLQKNGFDMTHEQLVLLMIISREKGINQKELAQNLDRDKTSIARSISKLERNHKVVRIQTAGDKRINNLYLTKEGIQLLNDIRPVVKALRTQLKQGFSPEEIELVVSFMKRLTKKVVGLESKL
ncbi:MAG: MarR family transcriptional regulator [Bacteroidales bacterium]|nr:MarR family transcriptional regulator [Bacteroidales bacterium]